MKDRCPSCKLSLTVWNGKCHNCGWQVGTDLAGNHTEK